MVTFPNRIFAVGSMVLGMCALAEATGTIIGYPVLAATGMNFYLILAPLWVFWFGWRVMGQTYTTLHTSVAKRV